jgi:hypothetical protein
VKSIRKCGRARACRRSSANGTCETGVNKILLNKICDQIPPLHILHSGALVLVDGISLAETSSFVLFGAVDDYYHHLSFFSSCGSIIIKRTTMAVSRRFFLPLWAAALITTDVVIGFQPSAKMQRQGRRTSTTISDLLAEKSSTTALLMSSIPEDEDKFNTPSFNFPSINIKDLLVDFKLPPLPEDHFALSGDIAVLFVYSYVDHIINALFQHASHMDLPQLVTATLDPNSFAPVPAWFDPYLITEHGHWLIQNSIENPYSPAIAASGLAFVSISFCWIVCGYFTRAFQMRNTLECNTSDAILVAGRTWVFSTLLMVALVWGSDYLWHQIDLIRPQSAGARGGITISDADFIFDSLTVLAFWRSLYNTMLGYRRK